MTTFVITGWILAYLMIGLFGGMVYIKIEKDRLKDLNKFIPGWQWQEVSVHGTLTIVLFWPAVLFSLVVFLPFWLLTCLIKWLIVKI